MTRSGSSAVVYASAHALGWAVADEPFGPWDRTCPPYNYPAEQVTLHRAHLAAGEILTKRNDALFQQLMGKIAENTKAPGVIVKLPHAMVDPDDIRAFRPSDRLVYLLRNPLARLNSLHTRRWQDTIQPPHDLERVKLFLHRVSRAPRPNRLVFEDFSATPRKFFRKLWQAWGIVFDESQVEAAVSYRAQHYHESSATEQAGRNPHRVLSEHRRAVPAEAVAMYLHDPVLRVAFDRWGWSTDPSRYTGP